MDAMPEVDAIVHLAAIPSPLHSTPDHVFRSNITSTHTVFSAASRVGVRRVVWASSETTLGLPFDTLPDYAPIDEEHELRPDRRTPCRRRWARRWPGSSTAGAVCSTSAFASRTSWCAATTRGSRHSGTTRTCAKWNPGDTWTRSCRAAPCGTAARARHRQGPGGAGLRARVHLAPALLTPGRGGRTKPSVGLEPTTPSLPWKCSTN
jgi:hypothetical protein